ncbi:M15 family metallopeptidase, partial [Streptosporangium sandarakinum]
MTTATSGAAGTPPVYGAPSRWVAFQQLGWEWGGYWSGPKDLQHFSKG